MILSQNRRLSDESFSHSGNPRRHQHAIPFSTLTLLLLALPGPMAARPQAVSPAAPGERILYRDATLIDGGDGPSRAGMDVLVIG
ncbi:MAG: hypothetical protein EOO77_42110, partial [Oxalobacteraceae bacterium]